MGHAAHCHDPRPHPATVCCLQVGEKFENIHVRSLRRQLAQRQERARRAKARNARIVTALKARATAGAGVTVANSVAPKQTRVQSALEDAKVQAHRYTHSQPP